MRVALISDIHGNLLALEAVLRDVRAQGVDTVACLGDVATLGPRPIEVLQRVEALGGPCILGNHDEFLLEPQTLQHYTQAPVIIEAVRWCQGRLPPAQRRFLESFVARARLELAPGLELLLFHGSPQSNMQDLLSDTRSDELDELLGPQRAAVMAGGHTHLQMLRQHDGGWLLNPGSVGMPFRRYVAGARPDILAHAEYALVDGHRDHIKVELKRVSLDKRALRAQAHAWQDAPPLLRDDLVAQYS